jgi:alpha,alpha-trehalase
MILDDAHLKVASLFDKNSNVQTRDKYRTRAAAIREGILDLNRDASKFAFYDYNHVTNARSNIFTAANFYPYWLGIVPAEVTASKENAFKAFSSVNLVMSRYNGTFPATFIDTGLQWDAPNAWPMHQHIIVEALGALPANVSSGDLPSPAEKESTFSLIPAGQLGIEEKDLIGQPVRISDGHGGEPNATRTGSAADINVINGTVVNGGNATEGEGWRTRLQREVANRYITSAFCSWYVHPILLLY